MSSLLRRIQLGRNGLGRKLGCLPLRTNYSYTLPPRGSRRKPVHQRTFTDKTEAEAFCASVHGKLQVTLDPNAGNGSGATIYRVRWLGRKDGDRND